MAIFILIALYLSPLFLASIGVNYVEKKDNIKRHRPTTLNTFWLTASSAILVISTVATLIELT